MTSGPQPAETQLTVFHGSCVTHENAWRLTCEELENLRAHSGYACGVCRHYGGGLVNDHDHRAGKRAIRGTLCFRCNANYIAFVDNGKCPIGPRTREYLISPWHLARQGKTLSYDPVVSVSVNSLSERDRAELERIKPRDGVNYIEWYAERGVRFEHEGIAACVAAGDLRPVLRLIRCAFRWYLPDLDISATGLGVPGGFAERDVLRAPHGLGLTRRAVTA